MPPVVAAGLLLCSGVRRSLAGLGSFYRARLAGAVLVLAAALTAGVVLLRLGLAADRRLYPPAGPDVVFIVVDTLRADHLSCYGHGRPTSPHLDAFARESVRFADAVSLAPWTTPSVAGTFASRYPTELGFTGGVVAVPPGALLLAELFENAGYHTRGIVSHLYVGRELGLDQGFEAWDQENALGDQHVSSPSVTEKALAFLENRPRRPFFLFLHYFDPHYDYVLHPEYDFAPGYRGPLGERASMGRIAALREELDEEDLDYVRALYDSEIRFVDEHLGRLLSRLRRLDLYEDTLIAFTAHHGEELDERGTIGHGHSLYQELIHVPLVVKPPGRGSGRQGGRVFEGTVSLLDLAPTVAELAGVAPARSFRGRPLPVTGPGTPRQAVAEMGGVPARVAVLGGGWKLIQGPDGVALYDLAGDPGETAPRDAADAGAAGRELGERLLRWRKAMAEAVPPGEARPPELTPDQVRQLKALGYLQ